MVLLNSSFAASMLLCFPYVNVEYWDMPGKLSSSDIGLVYTSGGVRGTCSYMPQ